MDEFDESHAAGRPKPSKIPSWVMLGFIFGAVFVWALPRPHETSAPAPVPVEVRTTPMPSHPRLSDVEAIFADWGRHAVWADDTTYVCMWDTESRTYRDCFEVQRRGEALYFRSVPRPRNLRRIDGLPENSPLEFLNPVAEPRGFFNPRVPAPERAAVEAPVVAPPAAPRENIPVEINPPKL